MGCPSCDTPGAGCGCQARHPLTGLLKGNGSRRNPHTIPRVASVTSAGSGTITTVSAGVGGLAKTYTVTAGPFYSAEKGGPVTIAGPEAVGINPGWLAPAATDIGGQVNLSGSTTANLAAATVTFTTPLPTSPRAIILLNGYRCYPVNVSRQGFTIAHRGLPGFTAVGYLVIR